MTSPHLRKIPSPTRKSDRGECRINRMVLENNYPDINCDFLLGSKCFLTFIEYVNCDTNPLMCTSQTSKELSIPIGSYEGVLGELAIERALQMAAWESEGLHTALPGSSCGQKDQFLERSSEALAPDGCRTTASLKLPIAILERVNTIKYEKMEGAVSKSWTCNMRARSDAAASAAKLIQASYSRPREDRNLHRDLQLSSTGKGT